MATNKQLINDWINCKNCSAKETDFLNNNSLFDAIIKVLEDINCEEQVFTQLFV